MNYLNSAFVIIATHLLLIGDPVIAKPPQEMPDVDSCPCYALSPGLKEAYELFESPDFALAGWVPRYPWLDDPTMLMSTEVGFNNGLCFSFVYADARQLPDAQFCLFAYGIDDGGPDCVVNSGQVVPYWLTKEESVACAAAWRLTNEEFDIDPFNIKDLD